MAHGRGIHGTLISAVGPPGCGKTYSLFQLGLRIAKRWRIPFIGIDPTGELVKYREGFALWHEENGDTETAAWLRDDECVKILELGDVSRNKPFQPPRFWTIDGALDFIESFIAHNVESGIQQPGGVVFLDELALIRELRANFQNQTIPRARNAGVLFLGTCHTREGMTPKARICQRASLGWKTTNDGAELCGRWLDNDQLSVHQSDIIRFVTPWSTDILTLDLNGDIPEELSLPVFPTQVLKRKL